MLTPAAAWQVTAEDSNCAVHFKEISQSEVESADGL